MKPGMTGVGRSVFQGEEIDTFGVVVVDVAPNFYPGEDVIIVRLTGPRAEQAGVVAGMSGSPIYLQGRLAGALAMRFLEFQKEPYAGVMPIASMMRASDYETRRGTERPCAPQSGQHYLRAVLLGAEGDFWQRMAAPLLPASPAGMAMRRIETPLLFSGFSEQTLSASAELWSSLGFAPMMGGESVQEGSSGAPLEPGSAISQLFIRGDFSMDMTGTVTAVEGDQLLAFGHYLFNLGPVQMPMARSRILATLPSLMGSSKLARSLEVIGTIRQDRLSGVYGRVGVMPAWIPVQVELTGPAGRRSFHFEMADDPALRNLTPFFLRSALFQALVAGKLGAEPSTVRLSCNIDLKDGRRITVGDYISYQERLGFLGAGSEIAEAVDLVTMSIGALTVNTFDPPPLRAVEVTAQVEPGERVAAIRSIRQDRLEVSPGDSLHLTMTLQRTSGQEIRFTQCVVLPRYLQSSTLTVIAGGAAGLIQAEMQSNPDKYRPDSFSQLCALLEERRTSDNLYLQIREPARGMVVDGEELTGLPPSILRTMNGRGSERILRDRVLAEWAIPADCEITGLKRMTVRITQPRTNWPDDVQDGTEQLFLE
ncbi:MAG TPA: SpoIVB peptidase S55 domain-containing protein [bacterium]|nr:SpoIVB peptidase S55 domain-containing protein [bacterium]HOH06751.1 SpoIVB peptidase S55 domain-containing protein [bacterium]